MSNLKKIREFQNLTQEELSSKSGISVRTIQRIEAGNEPKGYTLRILAETLNIAKTELLKQSYKFDRSATEEKTENESLETLSNSGKIKLINLSSLPFVIVPLLNILAPLLLNLIFKIKAPIIKQIISLQIIWTVFAPILFFLGIFLKLGSRFTIVLMILLILSNVFLILRNAFEIDRNEKLYYKLNFSMI
ncbi:MAG: helix-turn-helix transcriptional regulator [Chryseobacterium sp.]|nr:helix-turn-helix transcriptional regulator [Chryseobacterium sp.]